MTALKRPLPDWKGFVFLVPQDFLGPGTPGWIEIRPEGALPQVFPHFPPGLQFATGSWWEPAPELEAPPPPSPLRQQPPPPHPRDATATVDDPPPGDDTPVTDGEVTDAEPLNL